MRYQKNGSYYQLRLERGEEIIPTLSNFIQDHRLKSGILLGLGAGTDLKLGCYNLKKRTYHQRHFKGEYEICSLVGNIAWADNEPILHIHAVISNERLTTYSGHLFAGKVAATCEIAILPGIKKLKRELEPDSGLKLLQL
jgi:predicted DNA-binding protein with PD1-like motif|uniref:DNA-binding protein n=1 Tax=candidate division WOR-3 bacterium TaxID=2052148 RepID=A0A7V3PTM9_UNCW3